MNRPVKTAIEKKHRIGEKPPVDITTQEARRHQVMCPCLLDRGTSFPVCGNIFTLIFWSRHGTI